jgi:UDP-3-O-[3-hydroxymyristoyl] N-acetylglucosamine deacetylase
MLTSASQHTLKSPLTLIGVGLHSGANTTITVEPAPASTGIVFVRTDVRDRDNVVPAKWDHVIDTKLCTVLGNKTGVTVSTVEHLLSACAAMGLDNAVVHIDGPEVPIMDGSAQKFVAAIERAGLTKLRAARKYLRIRKTVSYQEGEKEVFLSPADSQYFGFEISFPSPAIGRQKFTLHLKEDNYRADVAPARTFGFLHEVEALRKMGLARGGSLDNAIVIDGDKVLNPGGLRFKTEFVRHKVLDAIGDLYLAGCQLFGHYHGVKAGHAMNNKILHVLFSQPDAFEIVDMVPQAAPQRLPVTAGRNYGDADLPVAVTA